jgi:hypothetical protein
MNEKFQGKKTIEEARHGRPEPYTKPPSEAEVNPEWYQRTRPTQGVRTKEGDRSDWSGASARGQNWAGGRER